MRLFASKWTTTAAAGIVVFLGACGADGGAPRPTPGDDTLGPIVGEELSRMVLDLAQFPPEFENFVAGAGNGALTLEAASAEDFNPAEERADLTKFGWDSGYEATFNAEGNIEDQSGVFLAASEVTLFKTLAGAQGYFDNEDAELLDNVGTTSDNVTLNEAERIQLSVADDASGGRFKATLVLEDPDPDDDIPPAEVVYRGMVTAFRRGRLVGTVAIYVADDVGEGERERLEGRLKDLTRKMNEQIAEVLAGPAASPGS